jgi:hypothetical protein
MAGPGALARERCMSCLMALSAARETISARTASSDAWGWRAYSLAFAFVIGERRGCDCRVRLRGRAFARWTRLISYRFVLEAASGVRGGLRGGVRLAGRE